MTMNNRFDNISDNISSIIIQNISYIVVSI